MISTKWIPAALLLPLLVGCAADGTSGTQSNDVVVATPSYSDKVTVYPDRLEFDADVRGQMTSADLLKKIAAYAAAPATAEPVYFVGQPQSDALNEDGSIKENLRNPQGYLRRAVSAHDGPNGTIVVQTEPATMAEAVEEMKKTGILDLDQPGSLGIQSDDPLTDGTDVASGWGNTDKTWHKQIGPAGGYKPIALTNKDLWSRNLLSGGNIKVQLANGTITIVPTVDVHLVVHRFIPRTLSATISTDITGDLEFLATADGAFDLDQGNTLFSKKFGTSLKGLPLSLNIDVKWSCQMGATGQATARFGATAMGDVSGGVQYANRSVGGILNPPTFEFAPVGPTVNSQAHFGGNCHLISTVSLEVFDSSGPNVSADLYALLDVNGSNAQLTAKATADLKAGVHVNAGGALKPFGFQIADIQVPPYNYEKELFHQDISVGGQ